MMKGRITPAKSEEKEERQNSPPADRKGKTPQRVAVYARVGSKKQIVGIDDILNPNSDAFIEDPKVRKPFIKLRRKELYDRMCCILADYEQTDPDEVDYLETTGIFYDMLIEILNNWEVVITHE